MPKTHLLILVLLTAIICSPLFRPGLYTSPDGEHHLVRLAWFSRYLSRGEIYPRWIPPLNYGLGLPIFTFIYPLPYYLASAPALLGLTLVDSLKITLLLATFASAVFFYLWVRRLATPGPALAAAILFLFTPYRFVDLYVRLALGEVVFLAVIPALFAALESRHFRLSALALAAVMLSHLQLTVIFLPIIIIYCLIRRLPWIRVLITGLALSAFFWLPALWLKQFTFFDSIRQFPPADHLATLGQLIYTPWGFGFSRPPGQVDDMSFQLGLANWAVLLMATVFWHRGSAVQRFFTIVSWLAIVPIISSPLGLWSNPVFAPVQFPWRFLVIPLVFIPILLSSVKPKLLLLPLLLLAIYANRNHIRTNLPQFVNTPDTHFLQTGTSTMATPKEFMPLIYDSRTPWLFTSSPIVWTSAVMSALAAGTIIIWPRSRFA